MKRRICFLFMLSSGSGILTAMLLWLLTLPAAAQEPIPAVDRASDQAITTESKNFTLMGSYGGSSGYIGRAIDAFPFRAFVDFDSGLQVLDISNPAAVRHLGGRDIPNGGIKEVERVGGWIHVLIDRPSGLGGDYYEILSEQPITKPTLLGTYKPSGAQGGNNTAMLDMVATLDSALYLAQDNGIAILNRTSTGDKDGNVPLAGFYATDTVYNLEATGNLLVADTTSGLELLTPGFSPSLVGRLKTNGPAFDIAIVGDVLYRATGTGLEVISIKDRTNPLLLRTISELNNIRKLQFDRPMLYSAELREGVASYYAYDPQNLVEVGRYQEDNFSAVGLTSWFRTVYATGNHDGMRILKHTGERPNWQARATGPGVEVDGKSWTVGQTQTFTQPLTIRLAQAVAKLDLEGECLSVLRLLMTLEAIREEKFDPFEVFVEVLALSPTICEPTRPQPVARSATDVVTEARLDLRIEKGGLRIVPGDYAILQHVKTPVATATSRGQNGFRIQHDPEVGQTTVTGESGTVTVTPGDSSLSPVNLGPGQAVDVTANSISEVRFVGGIFLPALMR